MNSRTFISIALIGMLVFTACTNIRKKEDWRISLDKDDKKPYGAYLAFQSLKYFFPNAEVKTLSRDFRYSSLNSGKTFAKDGKPLLIAAGLDFYISEKELNSLKDFIGSGGELIIFARNLDDKLQKWLHCSLLHNGYEEVPLSRFNNGSDNLDALSLKGEHERYGYQGRSVLGSLGFINSDSALNKQPPDTMGFVKSNPNFFRYTVGKGHLYLHAAPLSLSNYFLLQGNNRAYLQGIWNVLPENISVILWNSYYKRSVQSSDLSILLRHPETRWAIFLVLFVLAVYILFESKRRQRTIPETQPLENSSASFVETIGRLYFEKKDHNNLALKMTQHFLEWVRSHYFINTRTLDDAFVKQLQAKSGIKESTVKYLVDTMSEIQRGKRIIDEAALNRIYHTMEQFYHQHSTDGSTTI